MILILIMLDCLQSKAGNGRKHAEEEKDQQNGSQGHRGQVDRSSIGRWTGRQE